VTPPPLAAYTALHAAPSAIWLAEGATARAITRGEAIRRLADAPAILLNAPLTGARIGYPDVSGLDLLELFAFVRSARFCVPTPGGLARALALEPPADEADAALLLLRAAEVLLAEATTAEWRQRAGAETALRSLVRLKWPWAPLLADVPPAMRGEAPLFSALPEWEDAPPRPRPADVRLNPEQVQGRLRDLLGPGSEDRAGQRAYADAVTRAFQPRELEAAPNVVLAQAGTGIGKTLGYLAPAAVWAQEARGTVWISTHTKALQRQLDHELDRVVPNPAAKARRVVLRKGRENYLCLLNLEDAIQGGFTGRAAILAQLAARWARYTRDGDMVGGDFPGWLSALFGASRLAALTDRRGECVYASCPHYRRCFIERSSRRAAAADLIIANHALTLVSASRGRADAPMLRLVFDEGHHLFEAADSIFSAHLTGAEGLELRRWVLGPEGGRARGRRRGLEARLGELLYHDEEAGRRLSDTLAAARLLPGEGWLQRVAEDSPFGPFEALLCAIRAQVYARTQPEETGFGLETEVANLLPAVVETAQGAAAALEALLTPMAALRGRLGALLEDQPEWLDAAARGRLEGAASGLQHREQTLIAWAAMLARLGGPADPAFIDWFGVDRGDAREFDIGLHRHWLDPTRPFARVVLEPAHGVVITSATLKDRAVDAAPGTDWRLAELRTGANHLVLPPQRFDAPSPFDYASATRVLIVTDVKPRDTQSLAGAYRALIRASGGGALGLFTAIARLKAVFARIAGPLAGEGLALHAQHVDPIDAGTLVDMFRFDAHASLLGTDALRDGVDVPGESLRLVVLEGVPWPRPTVLHAARRLAFGGQVYDDMVIRARLAQAFGRLIRRAGDRGVFVLLGAAVPSRLLTAFPEAVAVERVTLDQAAAIVRSHLGRPGDGLPPPSDGGTSGSSFANPQGL